MQKHNKKVNISNQTGTFSIISCSALEGEVRGESDKYFWDGKRHSKKEYQELIRDSQIFFNNVATGKVDANDPTYFVYGDYRHKDIGAHIDFMGEVGNAVAGNFWVYDPVKVRKKGNSYICGSNGRHRFAAARGMEGNLLVCLEDEEANETDTAEAK